MSLDEIVAWLNKTYPDRDWNQWCQRLMWNVVHVVSGTPERDMAAQDTATIARRNSYIESTDASTAPVGAMHWFLYPADGHVGVSLGGERVLMTGTKEALGGAGVMLGTNYGTTTVASYKAAKGNPYLGWSRTNGKNPSIVGMIGGPPAPPEGEKEDEDMNRPICVAKTTKGSEVEVTIFSFDTGEEHVFSSSRDAGGVSYNNNVALTYGCAPQVPVSYISVSHYDKIKSENAATRKRLASK